jgi:hypothetical protein
MPPVFPSRGKVLHVVRREEPVCSQLVQFFGTAWLFILLATFGGCTTYQRQFAELKPGDAARIAPYAMMAANAYNPEKQFPIERLGWTRLKRTGNSAHDTTQNHRFSLAYDIYCNDSRRQYAFVFRGTDSYLDFLWANLAVGTSLEYGFAEREFVKFRREVEKKPAPYNDYKIVLVGHSLGGGMSLRESVVHGVPAIVFDPSPRLFGPAVSKFEVARRDVVFEKGEILAPLRERTSAWYLATKRGEGTVYEVNYDFGKEANNAHGLSKMAKLHSMPLLAAGIVEKGVAADPRLRNAVPPPLRRQISKVRAAPVAVQFKHSRR